ncbi:MAG: 5'-3' exonuclease H3TH domain-containing protein [Pseudomonadales bacterium]
MAGSRLLLVDAFNLVRRIYEARGDGAEHMDEVIEASRRSLERALGNHSPTHACAVFDSHDKTWRHLLYPDYKANRKPTPPALLANLQKFRTAFKEQLVESLKVDNYEADDQIATLARGIADAGGEAIILSTDRAFLQLLSSRIRVFNHFEGTEINATDIRAKFGCEVSQLTDLWAMAGDASNNIKGVPRIGKKTAANLLAEYGSLEEVLRGDDDNASAVRVRENGDLVQRCKQLVTLKTDVALGINLKSLRL